MFVNCFLKLFDKNISFYLIALKIAKIKGISLYKYNHLSNESLGTDIKITK